MEQLLERENTAAEGVKIAETPPKKRGRDSGFELMRIFGMLLIIAHHLALHGGGVNLSFDTGINRSVAQILVVGCSVGVNTFFILSGYFLIEGKFKLKHIIKLDLSMIFYALITTLATTLIWNNPDGGKWTVWAKALCPNMSQLYWFLSVYITLYFLFPFINRAVLSLSKKQFTVMLAILLCAASLVPSLRIDISASMYLCQLNIGVFGYLIGAYLRKYPIKFMDNVWVSLAVFLVSYSVLCAISVLGAKLADVPGAYWKMLRSAEMTYISLLNVISSAAVLMMFKNIKIGSVKWINFISRCCLGVYLIHDAPAFRKYLWEHIVKTPVIMQESTYLQKSLLAVILIFIGCSIIETARIYILEKPIMKIKRFDRYFAKVDKFMNNINSTGGNNEKDI